MRRNTVLSAVFVTILTTAGASLAWADTIETKSTVASATIFTDRAIVNRTTRVHVPSGIHSIAITDIPAGMNEATVRVQGKASSPVKIGTVEVKHIFMKDAINAAEREKSDALRAKGDERDYLNGEITALETREDFINQLVEAGADKTDAQNQRKIDFTPEKWAQALTTLQTSMADVQKELVTKRIALRKIEADIAQLTAELEQVRANQGKQRRDAVVSVDAEAETDLTLTLSYQTTGAVWQPVYDARLDTNTGELKLEQYGQVSQQTGEDWKDVDLTLSTAAPANGSEMPRMGEWWVRIMQSMPYVVARAMGGIASAGLAKSVQTVMPAAAPVPAEDMAGNGVEDEEVDSTEDDATTKSSEFSAEFKVTGHVDVPSSRDRTKLYISTVAMKAGLASQTSPRLGTMAYLFAKVMNKADFPIIPGMVAKYRDGAFIGNAALPLVRPQEEANLSFGIDDRVKVTYQQTNHKDSKPALIVVGDASLEREYKTTVQNLHKTPVTISVFEQYPIANGMDIKVDLIDDQTTEGYAADPDGRQNVIIWSSEVAPQETKTYTIGFRVKYPKDKKLQGI